MSTVFGKGHFPASYISDIVMATSLVCSLSVGKGFIEILILPYPG
jgi:hypothetical protein